MLALGRALPVVAGDARDDLALAVGEAGDVSVMD
jgi:hypothetical protein